VRAYLPVSRNAPLPNGPQSSSLARYATLLSRRPALVRFLRFFVRRKGLSTTL
jgi:hypothetical protein